MRRQCTCLVCLGTRSTSNLCTFRDICAPLITIIPSRKTSQSSNPFPRKIHAIRLNNFWQESRKAQLARGHWQKIQRYYLEFLCFQRKLCYDEKIKTQKKKCGEKIEEISHCSQGNNIWLANNDGAAFLQSMQWMLRNFSATKIRVHKFSMHRTCLAADERKSKWPIVNATLWKDWRTLRAWRDSFNLSSNLQQAYYCSLADNA